MIVSHRMYLLRRSRHAGVRPPAASHVPPSSPFHCVPECIMSMSIQSPDSMLEARRFSFFSVPLLIGIGIIVVTSALCAQTVSHPVSEITSTARHYAYVYRLSSTQQKQLEYIIVRASNGDIKTVFNACDVCYPYDKGYSQSGTVLRCNNCGNRFPIDGLGNQSTGTCNPGYLPHTIVGDQVVIQVADLVTGAYYFPAEAVTGIDAPAQAHGMTLTIIGRRTLALSFPADARRTFRIYDINGRLRGSFANASSGVRYDLTGYSAGAYLLAVEESGSLTTNRFLVK
jgi:hypothetical protein